MLSLLAGRRYCNLHRCYSTAPRSLRVLRAATVDPYFNLATEQYIFEDSDPNVRTLFLWRNDKTIVIGRNQNPWKECIVQQINQDGIQLVRRASGGGAVYQDLGNACFTFLSHKENYSTETNFGIICNALQKFGIEALPTGRNDIHVNGKKISGSAFRFAGDRVFHHGTILMNVDVSKLGKYLSPSKAKLESKDIYCPGVTSVVQRVQNLQDLVPSLTYEAWCDAMIASFAQRYEYPMEKIEIEDLDYNTLRTIPKLQENYEKLRDWNWIYGETPDFTHSLEKRFNWGTVDVNIVSEDGIIKTCKIYSDSLVPQLIDDMAAALTDVPYDEVHIPKSILGLAAQYSQAGNVELESHCKEVAAWLHEAV